MEEVRQPFSGFVEAPDEEDGWTVILIAGERRDVGAEPLKIDPVGDDLVWTGEIMGCAVHRGWGGRDPDIELGVKPGEDRLERHIAEVGRTCGVKGTDVDCVGMEEDHQGKRRRQRLVEVDDVEAFAPEKCLNLVREEGGQGNAGGGAIGRDRQGHTELEEMAVIVFRFVVGAGGKDAGVVAEVLELAVEFGDMRIDAARIAEIERGHEEDSHQHPRVIAL
ncbi:hypothetical protein NITHO_1580008 [Nitrolancea hollandica Lb]|uniref:Uncharacterized protein n=1 Tax=Nitrolancea hollandica Lb TaxID=1129897 RepID=I4EDN7_9BACT|nr:hypothetical protein NITHO_1580008 [Nitrolancea hollandica Lb]